MINRKGNEEALSASLPQCYIYHNAISLCVSADRSVLQYVHRLRTSAKHIHFWLVCFFCFGGVAALVFGSLKLKTSHKNTEIQLTAHKLF